MPRQCVFCEFRTVESPSKFIECIIPNSITYGSDNNNEVREDCKKLEADQNHCLIFLSSSKTSCHNSFWREVCLICELKYLILENVVSRIFFAYLTSSIYLPNSLGVTTL